MAWQLARIVRPVGHLSRLATPSVRTNAFLKINTVQVISRRNIHPAILMLIKPVGKLVAMITGRTAGRKWRAATPEQKAKWKASLWNARMKIAAAGGIVSVAACINFITHLQETPVTNRRRFIAFTQPQFLKLAQYSYEMQMEEYKEQVVSPKHPVYRSVMDVAQKIVDSNQDFEFFRKQKWTVIVVESDEENAYVLPTGHIFVFTGLLRLTGDGSRLAVVLGHEMAHAFLSHSAEQVSFAAMIDWLIIAVMAAIWVLVPNDGIALITQWFYNKVVDIFLHLPYSRKLEEEADYVGLQLAAKACFDVRESSAFWDLMELREENAKERPPPEFLSTHPGSRNRSQTLDKWMAMAEEMRKTCRCPALPANDPRVLMRAFRADVEAEIKRMKQEQERKEQEEEERKKTEILHPKPESPPGVGVVTATLKSAES